MEFVQTHWLWTPIDDIEVMVRDGRVYDINEINLGSVDDLKSRGLEPIKKIMYFYMIRKIDTQFYFCSWVYIWMKLELAHKWWHDDGLKEATKRCEYLCSSGEHCEIVKFELKEVS